MIGPLRLVAIAVFACCLLLPRRAAAAPPTPPTVTVLNHTEGAIAVRVCAGSRPGNDGFSVQWITEDHYQAAGGAFPSRPTSPDICHAAFSSRAASVAQRRGPSRFNLQPRACTDVTVGDAFRAEPGAQTDCPGTLAINERFRFRASTKTIARTVVMPYAGPSVAVEATTLACNHDKTFVCQSPATCRLTALGRACCQPSGACSAR